MRSTRYDSLAPTVKPMRRPVLWISDEDFDAESAARHAAERDGGFRSLGDIARDLGPYLASLPVRPAAPAARTAGVEKQGHRPVRPLRRKSSHGGASNTGGEAVDARLGRTSRRPGARRAPLNRGQLSESEPAA
jgi:hypothetical protein